MMYGLKIEQDRIIYMDYQETNTIFVPDSSWKGYELSKQRDIIRAKFTEAVSKMDPPVNYSYLFNDQQTEIVWVVASKEIPLGFNGPFASFRQALSFGRVERGVKWGSDYARHRDQPNIEMFEHFFQKPFDDITLEDLNNRLK